jgi:hypothetical protein
MTRAVNVLGMPGARRVITGGASSFSFRETTRRIASASGFRHAFS